MPANKKRIVLVEDHTIVREGLRALLSSDPEIDIVGEASDGLEAVRITGQLSPDLVVMDLAMPKLHGLEAIREILRNKPATKIIVLTVHKNEEYILASFKAGAHGYVLKDASHSELITAIRTILTGKRYISPAISDLVIEGYVEGRKTLKSESSYDSLTKREREILKLIAEGYKSKEIAELLYISVKTVERHRANLMDKMDLHSISALTTFAIENGLVSNES